MHPIANWFWPTMMSLSLTYESHEASCNKRAYTYLGRRSASLMKEFWTLCILVMTVSEKTFACQSADINKKRQNKKASLETVYRLRRQMSAPFEIASLWWFCTWTDLKMRLVNSYMSRFAFWRFSSLAVQFLILSHSHSRWPWQSL